MIRNTQGAENVVKKYENRLREVHTVPTNVQEVENYCSELKVTWDEIFRVDPLFYMTLGKSCTIYLIYTVMQMSGAPTFLTARLLSTPKFGGMTILVSVD